MEEYVNGIEEITDEELNEATGGSGWIRTLTDDCPTLCEHYR